MLSVTAIPLELSSDHVQFTGTSLTGWKALSVRRASMVAFWPRYSLGTVFISKLVVPITEMLL